MVALQWLFYKVVHNDFFIMLSTMTFLIMRKSCIRNMWMFPNQVVIMLSTTTKFDELQIIVFYVNFTLSTLTNFYFVHINQNISMGSTLTKIFQCCPLWPKHLNVLHIGQGPHWTRSTLVKVHIVPGPHWLFVFGSTLVRVHIDHKSNRYSK